jgi:hypothetical protein
MSTRTPDGRLRLSIASPCPADWNRMSGNNRVRFCGTCRQNVYDLSQMTSGEVDALLARPQGLPCVRLFLRKDGTVVTRDCPRRAVLARRLAWSVFAGVCLFVTAVLTGQLAGWGAWVDQACPWGRTGRGAVAGSLRAPEPLGEGKGEIAAEPAPSERMMMGAPLLMEAPRATAGKPRRPGPTDGR